MLLDHQILVVCIVAVSITSAVTANRGKHQMEKGKVANVSTQQGLEL